MMVNGQLLRVKNLKMYFPIYGGGLIRKPIGVVKAVDNISFSLKRGQTLGIVGESGCGKTTTGRCIIGFNRPTSGRIIYDGIDLASASSKLLRRIRCRIQYIFQDPYSSLNPRMSIGRTIGEPIRINRINRRDETESKVAELLEIVGLDSAMAGRFPHEFSGGQRQRVCIARALAVRPEFLILDEPISALDVSIQAQIINLLEDLQDQLTLTYIFIAHDLAVVRHISDLVAIMYLGNIIEFASSEEIYEKPLHPYTQALLEAVPTPDVALEAKRRQVVLGGEIPSPLKPPSGCHFHPRCGIAIPVCSKSEPQLSEIEPSHWVKCHRLIC